MRQQHEINNSSQCFNNPFASYVAHLFKPLCGGDASERCRPVEPLLRRLVELDVDALLAAGAPQSPRNKVIIYIPQ